MPANLENSVVATGLKKVSFHSNPKEKQCQRMFKLLHNCTHLTCINECSHVAHVSLKPYLQKQATRGQILSHVGHDFMTSKSQCFDDHLIKYIIKSVKYSTEKIRVV